MIDKLYPYQRDIVKRIVDNYMSYDYFLINSPTGTGKTLTALTITSELLRKGIIHRALWFTRTHNEYYPIIRDVRKFRISLINPVPLIGKSHLCDSPLRMVAEELGEHINICKLCPKAPMKYSPELLGSLTEKGIDETLKSIPRHYCKYLTLWDLIQYSNLVLLTYPYLLGRARQKLDKNISYELMIIDEAHNLENLSEYISATLSIDHIKHLIMKGYNLRPLLELWTREYVKSNTHDIRYLEKGKMTPLLQSIDRKIFKLYRNVIEYPQLFEKKTIRSVLALIRFMQLIDSGLFELFVYKNGYKLINTDIHLMIKSTITRKAILMSGTLPSPEYISNVWGLEEFMYIDVVREYNIKWGIRKWIWSREVTTKLAIREKHIPVMKQYIDRILAKAEPIIFIVFPSYDYMKRFIDIANKYQCIVESEYGTKIDKIISKALEGKVKCIFAVAGGRLTEGIEITRNGRSMIKTIVMAGIPYPVPNDLLKRKAYHITKRLELNRSKYYMFMFHVPASVSTRQAIGRGIRHREDTNTIFLLDWRYHHFFKDLGVDKVIEVRLKRYPLKNNGGGEN